MDFKNDPIGYAIQDFARQGFTENIRVASDLCDEDILPVPYLFRTPQEMPEIELCALELCKGKVLDVGAAAGCHSFVMQNMGLDVTAIDTSKGAVSYLQSEGINAVHTSFLSHFGNYDTLLILMNGIGLCGNLEQLPDFLAHVKKLLRPNGKAICDSSDLSYLYQEQDGSMWVDLNANYHGEMKFQMIYKDIASEWFDWLYIDLELLTQHALDAGLACKLIMQNQETHHYLVTLTHL